MQQYKLLNDPVYGFVSVPYGLLFDLVEHRYFQRLRRIKQVSLTHLVYPGALHTRFHHALGALHLMTQAIGVLRDKGAEITPAEAEAVQVAILLHDIGHGPFSHTLEHTLISVHHETLSELFMARLNDEFGGRLQLAIDIFRGVYRKRFLTQLVSSQLDMDRMDYLNRDSYFTGVTEGVIGYDRLIKMLAVHEGELVVEEKGLYSVERFLTARRLMYWQVYLHKTVLSAELMLIQVMRRAKDLIKLGRQLPAPASLRFFLENRHLTADDFVARRDELLDRFAALDDTDIAAAVKEWQYFPDETLAFLANGLANRRLFRLEFSTEPFPDEYLVAIKDRIATSERVPKLGMDYFFLIGQETNSAYSTSKQEIKILMKTGEVRPMSQITDHAIQPRNFTKYYCCYPKRL
ncbi:MAG: HD domain-containing protein [Lewinella sp.]|nr:HD domain-containing protein [Lewinella sp.]